MTPEQAFNEDQRTRWNGIDGEYWTRQQDRLDRTLAPVTGPLLEFAAPKLGVVNHVVVQQSGGVYEFDDGR